MSIFVQRTHCCSSLFCHLNPLTTRRWHLSIKTITHLKKTKFCMLFSVARVWHPSWITECNNVLWSSVKFFVISVDGSGRLQIYPVTSAICATLGPVVAGKTEPAHCSLCMGLMLWNFVLSLFLNFSWRLDILYHPPFWKEISNFACEFQKVLGGIWIFA
jgi:hypothetical protein